MVKTELMEPIEPKSIHPKSIHPKAIEQSANRRILLDCAMMEVAHRRVLSTDEDFRATCVDVIGELEALREGEAPASVDRDHQGTLNAGEALAAFCGWLTTRGETIETGHGKDCSLLAHLMAEFCKVHDLPQCREGWTKRINIEALRKVK